MNGYAYAKNPHCWVVVKFTSPENGEIFKILAGWYGGYAGGDEWKINSGIVKVVDNGDHWEVHGHSGSVYCCYKQAERFSSLTESIFDFYSKAISESSEVNTMVHVGAEEAFKQFI